MGKYADTAGSSTCTDCPAGKTTFVSNMYSAESRGFAVGATSADQCVAVTNTACSTPPCPYLSKDASSNTYYANDGGQYSLAFNYFSACRKFGQLLQTPTRQGSTYPSGSADSDSSCSVCPANTPYFYAGGFSTLSSAVINPSGFSGAISQYVYGSPVSGRIVTSDGGMVYTSYYTQVAEPQCVSICPAGTGSENANVQGNTVQTCSNCIGLLGQVNPKAGGSCGMCARDTYAATDRAVTCKSCPYPYISDWNADVPMRAVAGLQGWQLEDYAQNVLQYRSCAADGPNGGGRALCLCLSVGKMLAVVLPITAIFIGLISFFVLAAVGCRSAVVVTPPKQQQDGFELVKTNGEGGGTELDAVESNSVHVSDNETPEATDPLGRIKHKPVLVGWRVTIGLLAYILVPFVDNMTDLAFILSNPFFNVGLFVAMCVAYVAPAFLFFKTLIDKKAVPRFYIVPMPARLLWDSYDSLYKVLVGFVILIPFAMLNFLTLGPWLALGCLLYTTKSFAIRPVANLWLHVWTGAMFDKEGTPGFEQRRRDLELAEWHPLDERVLNESIMAHILLEVSCCGSFFSSILHLSLSNPSCISLSLTLLASLSL